MSIPPVSIVTPYQHSNDQDTACSSNYPDSDNASRGKLSSRRWEDHSSLSTRSTRLPEPYWAIKPIVPTEISAYATPLRSGRAHSYVILCATKITVEPLYIGPSWTHAGTQSQTDPYRHQGQPYQDSQPLVLCTVHASYIYVDIHYGLQLRRI